MLWRGHGRSKLREFGPEYLDARLVPGGTGARIPGPEYPPGRNEAQQSGPEFFPGCDLCLGPNFFLMESEGCSSIGARVVSAVESDGWLILSSAERCR